MYVSLGLPLSLLFYLSTDDVNISFFIPIMYIYGLKTWALHCGATWAVFPAWCLRDQPPHCHWSLQVFTLHRSSGSAVKSRYKTDGGCLGLFA